MENTTAHTAGPWEIVDEHRIFSGAKEIATVKGNDGSYVTAEQAANARLIAAAPDFRKSLQWAMKHLPNRGTATYEQNYQSALSALAKAEGK